MRKSLVLAVVLSLGLASFAHGGAVTHQLAYPEETIMLEAIIDSDENTKYGQIGEFKRLLWDGDKEKENYRIPEGKALVITEVDFKVFIPGDRQPQPKPESPGTVFLKIQNLSPSGPPPNYPVRIGVYWDRWMSASKSHNFNTGIIVHHGAKITASVSSDICFGQFFGLELRGYLVTVQR